ncbi:MAG: helix-turn-helix transcriptional regulator [Rhodanobacteraceae bacterium]
MDGTTRGDAYDIEAAGTARSAPSADATLALGVVKSLSLGVAVLDSRALVVFANDNGRLLLERREVFAPGPTVLLHDARSNASLRTALAAVRANRTSALQLRDCAARISISALVAPLPLESSPHRAQPLALLAMSETFRARAIPDGWLADLFGLTPKESSVANWLVSGRPIDAYARERGVSLATARSQLKAVLAKTGMSRQVQLVAALSRLPFD